jgi:dTDP-4-amino-4,6-dideoxygalactose transaminase
VRKEEGAIIKLMAPILPSAEKILPYLKLIDDNRVYSNFGPLEFNLRERLANHFGVSVELLATCSNATMGILGALETSGAPEDTLWEMPAWTFTATAAALAYSKFDGSFVDVDSDGRMLPSKDARAIIDVLPFGDEWNSQRIGGQIGYTIVDAAASFDAIREIPVARQKPFAMILSLHATKILPAGEGGLFISNDPRWVARFKDWTKFGMERGRISSCLGLNAKMSEYSAAVCHASLDEWGQIREFWVALGKRATQISEKFNLPVSLACQNEFVTPYWIIKLSSQQEKLAIVQHFSDLGIETRDWWESGCHNMPAYMDFARSDLTITDDLASRTLGLPFHLNLTTREWNRINFAFESFFGTDTRA